MARLLRACLLQTESLPHKLDAVNFKMNIDALLLNFFRLARHLPPPVQQDFYWWLFCRPFTHGRDPEHLRFLSEGKPFFVPCEPGYLLPGWVFGRSGPTVVLCHGWQGSAASWHVLVPKLLDAGFRVITYNAPGHHARPRRSSLVDFSNGLRQVVETFGTDYLVGHSLGAMTVAREAAGIPGLKRVALYSVPDELSVLGRNYCRRMEMSPAAESQFLDRLSRHTPDGLAQESVTRYLAGFDGAVLLLHDKDDSVIPFSNSELLSERYQLEMIRTSGLGHRQIIRDPELADRVVAFLQR